jgi:murein DD-endopeptidase MepM/ murein hydrolase activator NlpD
MDRPLFSRAGLAGLLVVMAVVVGFGVGTRIGSAGPSDAVAMPAAAIVAAAPLAVSSLGSAAPAVSAAPPELLAAARPAHSVAIGDLPIYREAPELDGVESFTLVTRGEIGSGETLGSSLRRQGISPATVHLIATEMRKVFDFRHARAGDRYRLGQDTDGRVLDFRYSQSAEESYYLAWEGTRYVVRRETAELRPLIAKIAGVVDSSFYDSVLALGEQSTLAAAFAHILAWDLDFSRQVHPGDSFQILYERLYRTDDDGEEVYVRPGRILAGRYEGRYSEHTVVYFEDDDGKGAYFRPDGSSVERAFLAAPLEFSRITSRFTGARRHPILNVTRPHPGIDYAAPRGTPIWAVAEGVVEYRARAGASGNLIRIRHQGGLTSHYAHLASFAKGISVGSRVEQKQIIGYVGSTGLSTGPHVCFRVKRDGAYVDPMKISGPAGDPVGPSNLSAFASIRDQLLADLGPRTLTVADGAL